jgi:hypothetical protein
MVDGEHTVVGCLLVCSSANSLVNTRNEKRYWGCLAVGTWELRIYPLHRVPTFHRGATFATVGHQTLLCHTCGHSVTPPFPPPRLCHSGATGVGTCPAGKGGPEKSLGQGAGRIPRVGRTQLVEVFKGEVQRSAAM